MKKRVLKKPVIIVMYALGFLFVIGSIIFMETTGSKEQLKDNTGEEINKTIFENEDVPVVATETVLIKPYTDEDVKILKNYYDYKAEEEKQKQSIIYYEKTYLPSSGISFGKEEPFNVVSVLDGTVISIKDDEIMGKTVEIKHDNDIVSTYQSLSEVNVEKNSKIKQGDIIGKSGKSNIEKELPNHLHFELVIKNKTVNPLDYFDKNIN